MARLTGSFLIGILIHESFEVNLIQNNLTIGIVMWSVLAVGIGSLFIERQINNPS